jgi:hypothetical protein
MVVLKRVQGRGGQKRKRGNGLMEAFLKSGLTKKRKRK